jgi:hypothetical protein
MYARLDDALFDHRKVFEAGELIGKNGPAVALGFYTACVLYVNKHLTDGVLSAAVIRRFPHADKPEEIASALVKARLLDEAPGGYRIHDYHDHNPTAESVKKKRAADRDRKRQAARES